MYKLCFSPVNLSYVNLIIKPAREPRREGEKSFPPYAIPDCIKSHLLGFPGDAVVKNPPANAGDTGSSPGLGRSHMLWSN